MSDRGHFFNFQKIDYTYGIHFYYCIIHIIISPTIDNIPASSPSQHTYILYYIAQQQKKKYFIFYILHNKTIYIYI